MDRDPMDQDLDAAARRRFWLLRALMERGEPPLDALEQARRLESFITGTGTGGTSTLADPAANVIVSAARRYAPAEHSPAAAAAAAAAAASAVPSPAPARHPAGETPPAAAGSENVDTPVPTSLAAEPSGTAVAPRQPGPLGPLDRARFARAVEEGASNADLARMFRLTPRQANCVRLGVKRKGASGKSSARRSPQAAEPALARAAELQMQEAFLQHRARAAETMEDVVRFLRQRGDSVVQSAAAGAYVVNGGHELSAEQLIGRANAQRARLGQPPFAITPPAAPGAPPLLAAPLPDRAA